MNNVRALGASIMSERVDIHLGKRLRWRRKAMGLTQQDLARALGVRFQQVQKYECAINRMSASMVWKAANILDVDIRYFFDGLGELSAPRTAALSEGQAPAT
jgi:transcriptional regulator with XRE-family HTH domain